CPHCKTPATYIISHFCYACHIHDKKLIQTPPPPPSSSFSLPHKHISKKQDDGFYKDVTSWHLGISYRKSYAFHDVFKHDNGSHTARTLITYSAHKSISHPMKKQLAH
ncbi:19763_t:CDS:1, partial [Rhizophagus irregularis]